MLLEKILVQCEARHLLQGKKKQRTDATHVLAAVRHLSQLELVGETVRRMLDAMAQVNPDWLQARMQPEWIKRYGRGFEGYRLPKGREKLLELAIAIGQDGYELLAAASQPAAPEAIRMLPAVEVARCIWVQQYYWEDGQVHWRSKKKWGQPPSSKMIVSPGELEARFRIKRNTEWIGYQVHLTETCDHDHPRLITQVETTVATVHDSKVTATIQEDLSQRGLLPEIQLVDEGYTETDLLVSSRQRGIDLVGPLPSSKSWQDRTEGAFDHTCFHIDWESRVATCPAGKQSRSCSDRQTWRGTPNVQFAFNKADCHPCALRQRCTRSKTGARNLTIYPEEKYKALQAARERQKTDAFQTLYKERAGIEGTMSQGVRKMGMRKSRYIGLARTHLQHVATAAAINVVRSVNWLTGEVPEPTRVSPFQTLAAL